MVNAGAPLKLAERVRFELTVLAYTRVPGVHLKPLGHLSSRIFFHTLARASIYTVTSNLSIKKFFHTKNGSVGTAEA